MVATNVIYAIVTRCSTLQRRI